MEEAKKMSDREISGEERSKSYVHGVSGRYADVVKSQYAEPWPLSKDEKIVHILI
jgi:hypothetical protein